MAAHRFPHASRCIWCGTTPELVADRKAPPFCREAPEDVVEQEFAESRQDADLVTGY